MDRKSLLGGNPLEVVIRLLLLSLVVGVVLSALGITPRNLFYHLDILFRRIYDMGFGAVEWVLGYIVLGAIVVVPIWLVTRLLGAIGSRSSDDERK